MPNRRLLDFLQLGAIICVAGLLSACASRGFGTDLPKPVGITIIQPGPDLSPKLAAFSGIWEGKWDGVLPTRLIVERINATSAQVVYIWGADRQGRFKEGWHRNIAKVVPGRKIEFGGAGAPLFIFTISKSGESISGERRYHGHINIVTMKKIGSQ